MTSTNLFFDNVLKSLSILSASAPSTLLQTSDTLLQSFHEHLQKYTVTMLPSYTYLLPTGQEAGTAIAVDLGGSTLRVAVIQIFPLAKALDNIEGKSPEPMKVVLRESWVVKDSVKKLRSKAFFDWIAERIAGVVEAVGAGNGRGMVVGVTWSFPIEQTSLASGNVQKMGKAYETWDEIVGTDLKSHFDAALGRRGLRVRMNALMNDTEATLLSHAHANPATRLSLICGTGLNAALRLPLSAIGSWKLGIRPKQWTKVAKEVLVNTEVSMFGGGIFPLCDADRELDRNGNHPGFQPLEQLTGGRNLGEICRLIMVAGVKEGVLFEGVMPWGLEKSFSIDTSFLSTFEEKPTQQAAALLAFLFKFNKPPTDKDISSIRTICEAISNRAALYLAIAVFTLWRLQRDTSLSDPRIPDATIPQESEPVTVAYCGAVLEKHPTVRHQCQRMLDLLVEAEEPGESRRRKRLVLEAAGDSGLLGAAVGAIMNEDDERAGGRGLTASL
ncbi:hypothetical protein MMC14_010751 [Varicellaria rhodocarpa]|nr:hypothetical protein [Varicellaria rhodocarpa]